MKMKNSNKITKKDLRQVFIRSFALEWSWNYYKQQNIGFASSIIPGLDKLYKKDSERIEAYKRHLEFFNISPWFSTFVMGITLAMEEKNSNDENFDVSSINNIKVALMGPLSGIGDSFFWGTLRIIATGIGTSLAFQGSPLGAIFFLLIFNIPAMFIRYKGTMLGYEIGDTFIDKVLKSGLMDKLTYGASIVGLMVIGGMAATMISTSIPIEIGSGEAVQTISQILNDIFPNLVALLVFAFMFKLVQKEIKPQWILIIIAIVGIAGAYFGILA